MQITSTPIYNKYPTNKSLINKRYNVAPYYKDSITFSGDKSQTIESKYAKAQKYANHQKFLNFFKRRNLDDYNLDKLEGIQNGIKIFDGLNMKEIAFMLQDLHGIAVKRGCSNQCLHCYAGAKPAGKDQGDYITRMPYETFCELTDGIKKLKQRLGIDVISHHGEDYTDIYYDADCMEISLFDKNGAEHDYTDLIDRFYNATGKQSVFDTAGWNPKSKKMQERAEKYVKYMLDLDNQKKFHQINLSLSPFNAIYARAIALGFNPDNYSPLIPIEDLGKPISKGEKLYRIYINRMANVLYTFTPLLDEKNFSIISRPVKNDEKNMQNFTEKDYEKIKEHILERLYFRYLTDLKTDRKLVSSKEQILVFISKYGSLMDKIDTKLIPSGRFKELYLERNPEITPEEFDKKYKYVGEFNDCYETLKQTKNLKDLKIRYLKIIDANGKLYLYDTLRFIATDIKLNITTQNNTTPPLSPDVVKDFKVTKDIINRQ